MKHPLKNTEIGNKVIDIIFMYDYKKDYFGFTDRINTQITNWHIGINANDPGALEYKSEQEIADACRNIRMEESIINFLNVAQEIINKDINVIGAIRYDNPITLEIFTLITGIKTKGLSNKKLAPIVNDYFNI